MVIKEKISGLLLHYTLCIVSSTKNAFREYHSLPLSKVLNLLQGNINLIHFMINPEYEGKIKLSIIF